MRLAGALVLVPLLTAVPPLRAQERKPDLDLDRDAPPAHSWYGWQLIVSDLAAITLIGAAVGINNGPAPVGHAVHRTGVADGFAPVLGPGGRTAGLGLSFRFQPGLDGRLSRDQKGST